MRKENFNFKSANKKTDIYTTMWLPDSEPTAILQIAHGITEPNKTDCDWLCSDGKSLEDYLNDELCYREISAGLFRELLGGMIFTSNMNNIKKIDSDMPILLISGGDDPVGDQGKGIDMTKNSLEKAGIKKVDVKIYTGLRHDILHEACREEVYEYLYKWIIGNIKM